MADDTFAFAYPIPESHRSVLERSGQGDDRLPGTEKMAASERSGDGFASANAPVCRISDDRCRENGNLILCWLIFWNSKSRRQRIRRGDNGSDNF